MKDTMKIMGFIAAAAIALVGCTKIEPDDNYQEATLTHRVSINVGSPESKTTIGEEGVSSVSFKWSSDDAKRFVVKENSVSGSGLTITSDDSYATMTLGATFATVTAAEYVYSASLAATRTGSGAPKIPTSQTSTASSYDPDADILVAKPLTFNAVQNSLDMQFYRPAVINKMTLKGLTVGETISSITISANKSIIGYYSDYSWTGQGSEITITTSQTVPESGQISVYFVTMPASDVTLSVVATSANYIYSKTFTKTIDFNENTVTRFSVSSLTSTARADYSGTYVLTNASGTKMALAWASGNNLPATDVSLDGDVIYYNPDEITSDILTAAQVTLTKVTEAGDYYGMYTIAQNGKYLYAASSSANQLKGEDSPEVNAYWDVTNVDGAWSIIASKSSNRNILRNNGDIFSCYASGQTAIALYSTSSSVKPCPVITADNIAIASSAAVATTNTGATFNSNTNSVSAVAYNNAGLTEVSDWLTVTVDGTTVNYSAIANTNAASRTGYIKITATNSDSYSVIKTITVTQPGSGLNLTFTLTANPGGWPESNDTELTNYNYTLNATKYTFSLKNVKQNSGYLMMTQVAVLGLPAISGYKLTKVVASNSSGCSTATRVGVSSSSSSASYITGGAYQIWDTVSSSYTYDLSGTEANTVYYLYVTNKNCQLTSLTLTYEKVN